VKSNLTAVAFLGQDRFLEIHGDKIWEQLCDNVPEDLFNIRSAVARIRYLRQFKKPQRGVYLRCVLRNVASQDCPAIRRSGNHWVWVNTAGNVEDHG